MSVSMKKRILNIRKTTGYIDVVKCNFGEVVNDNYKPPIHKSKTNGKKGKRGRKKAKKVKPKRAKGNGSCMNSQITHTTRHTQTNHTYHIKLWRNGSCQIPGGKNPDMTDLIDPLLTIEAYLNKCFPNKDIKAEYMKSVTRNYKSGLIYKNHKIRIKKLGACIEMEKKRNSFDAVIDNYLSDYSSTCKDRLKQILKSQNTLQIAEISYDSARVSTLSIRMYRPQPNKPDKKVTIKITDNGKINFEGGNIELEVLEMYLLVTMIL
jgi:hypothetical protein